MRKTSLRIALLIIGAVSSAGLAEDGEVWPIKITPDLSSKFCDHREGHFHAGLDLRTNGKTGYSIYAIDDGYVYRVSMAHNGYGKAMYLRLTDGRIVVYGHLSSLGKGLDDYVRKKQMQDKKYNQNLIFGPGEFPVKKGQRMGLTGSSGSGAPHLHFEIRSENNLPVNPLKSGFSIDDSAPPVFEKLAISFYDDKFSPGNPCSVEFPRIERVGRKYVVADTLIGNGDLALAVSGGDLIGEKKSIYGFYGLKMFVDDSLVFIMNSDSISYETINQIEYVRDYKISGFFAAGDNADNDKDVFFRLYVPPRATQYFWGGFRDYDGIIELSEDPGRIRQIRIEAFDETGNRAVLEFVVKTPDLSPPPPDFVSYYKFADTIEVDFLTNERITGADTQFRNGLTDPFETIRSNFTARTWQRSGNIAYLNTVRVIAPYKKEDYRFRYATAAGRISPWIFFKDANELSGMDIYGSPDRLRIDYFPDSIYTDLIIQIQSETVAFDLGMYQRGIGLFSADIVDKELHGPTSVIIKKDSRTIMDTVFSLYPLYPQDYTCAYSPDSSLKVEFAEGSAFYPVYILPFNGKRVKVFGEEAVVYEIRPLYLIADSPIEYEFDLLRSGLSPAYLGAYGFAEKKNKWGFIEKANGPKIRFSGLGLGRIALIQDDTPPTINTLKPHGNIKSGTPALLCLIKDDISGVRLESDLEMKIDGVWVPAEYDIDTREFKYEVQKNLGAGQHKLEIFASDNQGNKTEKTSYFTILTK